MVAAARAVVCLSLCLSLCQIQGAFFSEKMNRTLQNLLQHYKIPVKVRFNGKPIFSKEPLSGKLEAKRVFMGAVLETYEKLIGQMLSQLPTQTPHTTGGNELPAVSNSPAGAGEGGPGENVRKELSYILKKVQDLKRHCYQQQEKLLQSLEALKYIQMDNLEVQSKALEELPWLYEEANLLNDQIKRLRRRRQARRIQTRPKA